MDELKNAIIEHLADGFEESLFKAAINNLTEEDNPLCFNNFAYATRELVRTVLARLSPDTEIRECSWYEEETGRSGGISRKQRVYFAVQGGLSDEFVENTLSIDVKEVHKNLRDAIDKLSKFTHITEKTFNIPNTDIEHYTIEVFAAVEELFKLIVESHGVLVAALWEQLDETIIASTLSETICSDEIHVSRICGRSIHFEAKGSIAVELQWGSNSDVRRGDTTKTVSFLCNLTSSVEKPDLVEMVEPTLMVDTSS